MTDAVQATDMVGAERAAMRARWASEMASLDYTRALRRWLDSGATWSEVAGALGISQTEVAEVLGRSPEDSAPVPGLSGASVLEICQRYAAGLLTRERLVEELATFPYGEGSRYSWGTWAQVEYAQTCNLIEADLLAEVSARRTPEAKLGEGTAEGTDTSR